MQFDYLLQYLSGRFESIIIRPMSVDGREKAEVDMVTFAKSGRP